jgi:hypothetical protein
MRILAVSRRAFAALFFVGLAILYPADAAWSDEPLLVIRNATDPGSAELRLTEAELLAMPQVTIRTSTEFTDGVIAFAGPLARDVIARAGVGKATTAHMVAANDYAVDIPISDFHDYDVVLALSADGKRLSMRDKGPIWLVYPFDGHSELNDPIYNARSIWQLTTVELR